MLDLKYLFAAALDLLGKPQPLASSLDLLHHDAPDKPQFDVMAVPNGMTIADLTEHYEKRATKLQPWRRTGTARMQDLESLIAWANRNKGETSVLFASVTEQPALLCIADYMGAGPHVMDHTSRDPAASHCRHRAGYAFPLSREWKLWNKISGQPLDKAELGAFVEANAKDFLAPSSALMGGPGNLEEWERNFLLVAQQVRGRFGAADTLITLSRRFEVNETSNITATRNPDTGESSFTFINEHQQPDGNPVQIPTLFLLALPVFENGDFYRIAARFRYQKSGSTVKFFLTLHNPDIALQDAIEGALQTAQTQTGLPLFRGTPEA